MKDLTDKQKDFLKKMVALTIKDNKPPTIRAMMDECGFGSPNAVCSYLSPLIKKGWVVQYGSEQSRSYHVIGIKYTIDEKLADFLKG